MRKFSGKKEQHETGARISSILDNCITIEKYTQTKYREMSKQTDNSRAVELFKRLSIGGEAHAMMLTEIKSLLAESGEISGFLAISTRLETPKEEKIPDDSEVKQIYYAMKSHLKLERDFKEIYTKLSEVIESASAQELFRQLIIDETNHHSELAALIHAFEDLYKPLFEKKL